MAEKGERTKKQERIDADVLELEEKVVFLNRVAKVCLLYTSPSPRDS